MNKRKKIIKSAGFILLLVVLFMFFNNTSIFLNQEKNDPLLLAHRGVHQTFKMEGITGDACTAERIFDLEHPYIENTIASMEAAFNEGADIVELDVHPTTDGEFAVFHDWTLNCRTDGSGDTREHTMEELRKLDIGYGYTADNGKTYPLRGKGVGMMPTLAEVLAHFSNEELLIHIKSDDPKEGELLARYLTEFSSKDVNELTVYGGDNPIASLKDALPEIRIMSKGTMKSCLIPYMAIGWTGYIPEACSETQLHIPEKIGPWLWGWSGKFQDRMDKVDTRVMLVAGDGGFSEGFDRVEDLERIPKNFSGWIWTNRVELIGLEMKQ